MRHIVQQRQHTLKSWTVFHRDLVVTRRNRCPGVYFLPAAAVATIRRVGTFGRQPSYGVFEGVAEIIVIYIEAAYGIGRASVAAFEVQVDIHDALR